MKQTKTLVLLLLGLILPLIIQAQQMQQGYAPVTCYGTCGDFDVLAIFDTYNSVDAPPGYNWTTVNSFHGNNAKVDSLGSIFGIAIDDDGDIYVTASSIYYAVSCEDNLSSSQRHIIHGNNTTPTLIYKIEGDDIQDMTDWDIDMEFVVEGSFNSGDNTLPNPPDASSRRAALGNITYSSEFNLLYVTNNADGKIYTIETNGDVIDSFDPDFDGLTSSEPTTISTIIPMGQRPWGIGVLHPVDDPSCHKEEDSWLYYSRWSEDRGRQDANMDNEIWAVRLDDDGEVEPNTEVLILTMPALQNNFSSPVSDIEFSSDFKKMIVGERTMTKDVDDNFAAHSSRVLEYIRVGGSGTDWLASPINKFKIGGSHRNCSGGVDYGANDIFTNYDEEANCDKSIWATSDAIRTGVPNNIYGVQGLHCVGGSVNNSVTIDLDNETIQQDKALIGDVDYYNPNCDEGVVIPEAFSSYSFDDCNTVSFDGPYGMDEYLWDFGNGNTSTDKNPSFTFFATDTITLTVTENGESDIQVHIINIDPNCVDEVCEESFGSTMQSIECNIVNNADISYDFDVHIWDEDDEFQNLEVFTDNGTITNLVIDYKNHNVVSINGNFTPTPGTDIDMFCLQVTSVNDLCEGETNCTVEVCAPLPHCECHFCNCLISNVVTEWPENITPGEEFCFNMSFDYAGIMDGTELRFYSNLDDDFNDDDDVSITQVNPQAPNTATTILFGENNFEICMVFEGDCDGDVHLFYDIIMCGMECKVWEMHQIPCGECTDESDKPEPLISYYYTGFNTVQFKGYPGFDEYLWDFGNLDDYDDDEHPDYTYYQYGTYNASLWVQGDDEEETYLDYIEVVIEEDCTPVECEDFFDANMHSVDCAIDADGNTLYDFEIHVWNPDDEIGDFTIVSDLGTITDITTHEDINNVYTIKGRFTPNSDITQLCMEVIWDNADFCPLDMCSTIPNCECQDCIISNTNVIWPDFITPEVEFCVELSFDYLGQTGLPIEYYVDLSNSTGDIDLTQVNHLSAPMDGTIANGSNVFELCFIYHGECKGDISLFFDGIIKGVDCKIWEMHDIPCRERIKPCDPKELGIIPNFGYIVFGDNTTLMNNTNIPSGWAIQDVLWSIPNDNGTPGATIATGDIASIPTDIFEGKLCMTLVLVNHKKESCIIEFCDRVKGQKRETNSNSYSLTLYPNPVSRELFINTNDLESPISQFTITNVQGKIMDQVQVNNTGLISYSTTDLAVGMYFIQLELENNEPIILKFIKE